MNKYLKGAVVVTVIAFLSLNLYLLYGKESVIAKIVYVQDYERMTEKDYEQELFKETLVAPVEAHTVYVGNEEGIDSWLVKEGDHVFVGQELATLSTKRIDSERIIWESEQIGLLDQQSKLENMRAELTNLRERSDSSTTSNTDQTQRITEIEEKATIELGFNIGFTVDITQEGSYAQAISAIDQELADVERQLTVLDAQLGQSDESPALISPVTGVVSKVTRHGSRLSIDIYDEEQLVVTYVGEKEWQQIEEGQRVKIQGELLDQVIEGDVLSISQVPLKDHALLDAYRALEGESVTEKTAYYEVRILPGESLGDVPYASNLKSIITVNEALAATAIPKGWGRIADKDQLQITKLQDSGYPEILTVSTPFTVNEQVVITDELVAGDIVLQEPALYGLDHAPKIYLPFPTYTPTKKELKTYGWRNYLKSMLIK